MKVLNEFDAAYNKPEDIEGVLGATKRNYQNILLNFIIKAVDSKIKELYPRKKSNK